MNYNEYFGNNANAGWGTSGKPETQTEDWGNYFEQQTIRVPVQKMYADSPVVTVSGANRGKTYLDVDPVIVERPSHEQVMMQQAQMMSQQAMIQQQKDYYKRIWDNKVNQMEEEVPATQPVVPGQKRKLSFVDKQKDVVPDNEKQNVVTIDEQPIETVLDVQQASQVCDVNPEVQNPDVPTFDIPFIPEYHEEGDDDLLWDPFENENKELDTTETVDGILGSNGNENINETAEDAEDDSPSQMNVLENMFNGSELETVSDEETALPSDESLNEVIDYEHLQSEETGNPVKEEPVAEPIVPIIPGETEIEDIVEEDEELPETAEESSIDGQNDGLGGLEPVDLFFDEEEPMVMDESWTATQDAGVVSENEQNDETPDSAEEPVVEKKKRGRKPGTTSTRKKPVVSTNKKKTTTASKTKKTTKK